MDLEADAVLKTPIRTLEQARRYFYAMGCSHFHMSRESYERFEEYRALHITDDMERRWRGEQFQSMLERFPYGDPSRIAGFFAALSEGVQTLHDLKAVAALAERIASSVPVADIAAVISVITGSNDTKTHGGLIETACWNGQTACANRLLQVCRLLLERAAGMGTDVLFVRGYLADVAEAFDLKMEKALIRQLRKEDMESQHRYFLRGAQAGDVYAMYMAGLAFAAGTGCARNRELAVVWLSKAAASGSQPAQKELERLTGNGTAGREDS